MIVKPGIYTMSFEDYKRIDAINNSKLVAASKTLAHVLADKEPEPCDGKNGGFFECPACKDFVRPKIL